MTSSNSSLTVILQLRIYVMYNRSKNIFVLMTAVLILSLTVSIGLLIADLRISGCEYIR